MTDLTDLTYMKKKTKYAVALNFCSTRICVHNCLISHSNYKKYDGVFVFAQLQHRYFRCVSSFSQVTSCSTEYLKKNSIMTKYLVYNITDILGVFSLSLR